MSATFMTPFFFLDPSSQGTRMTRERGYWDDSYPDNRHPTTC
ncbi:hypothetical protein RYF71_00915 [Wolbachia endosymbiont of Drosophila malagassya]|nr:MULTISPECIES: hypothetical protein [unclassified Wolbachia]MDE5058237.1 hypothetical protein [Wolbachia endosymbiont of Drosophila bocki]MDE5060442.1 hypothetical protein [Wolbachia endosymbiont of Drosophila burlai]MDU8940617.1 hypothetical protein [Wolbachia endosymbiont of Drosophila malagassya]